MKTGKEFIKENNIEDLVIRKKFDNPKRKSTYMIYLSKLLDEYASHIFSTTIDRDKAIDTLTDFMLGDLSLLPSCKERHSFRERAAILVDVILKK